MQITILQQLQYHHSLSMNNVEMSWRLGVYIISVHRNHMLRQGRFESTVIAMKPGNIATSMAASTVGTTNNLYPLVNYSMILQFLVKGFQAQKLPLILILEYVTCCVKRSFGFLINVEFFALMDSPFCVEYNGEKDDHRQCYDQFCGLCSQFQFPENSH